LDLARWRRAVCLPRDFVPPQNAEIRIVVDPAFTCWDGTNGKNKSDETAIAVGFVDEIGALSCLDIIHGRFRGIELPRSIVSAIAVWKPSKVFIEPTPFFDLLADVIALLARTENLEVPRISMLPRRTAKRAKALRIRRLETDLLSCDPPLLRIRQSDFVDALMSEVEAFDFDSHDNHRRSDNCIDSLALLAGF
jgi:hypothetical protein